MHTELDVPYFKRWTRDGRVYLEHVPCGARSSGTDAIALDVWGGRHIAVCPLLHPASRAGE